MTVDISGADITVGSLPNLLITNGAKAPITVEKITTKVKADPIVKACSIEIQGGSKMLRMKITIPVRKIFFTLSGGIASIVYVL